MMFTKANAIQPKRTDDEAFSLLELALLEWAQGRGTHEIAMLATGVLGMRVNEAEVYNLLAAARDKG
jgi:hypothetical protein